MEIENICIECSKPFVTNDEDMNYCPECWAKVLTDIDIKEIEENQED